LIILKIPFCKILTQNVLIIPLNYFFQTSSSHKSVKKSCIYNRIFFVPEDISFRTGKLRAHELNVFIVDRD